ALRAPTSRAFHLPCGVSRGPCGLRCAETRFGRSESAPSGGPCNEAIRKGSLRAQSLGRPVRLFLAEQKATRAADGGPPTVALSCRPRGERWGATHRS